MSKSDISDGSRVNLTDENDLIQKKIQKAKTDSLPIPDNEGELYGRPEAINLINIYSALSDIKVSEVLKNFSGKGFSIFKKDLTDLMIQKVNPISHEMKKMLNDKEEIKKILADGRLRAKEIAVPVMKDIKNIIGFIY